MIKIVNISQILYQTLRGFFSVNVAGNLSILYRFLYSCLEPVQHVFDSFDTSRRKQILLSKCTWTFGQATWVLNELYDTTLRRIVIGAELPVLNYCNTFATPIDPVSTEMFAPTFEYPTTPAERFINTFETIFIIGGDVKVYIPNSMYIDPSIYDSIYATLKKIVPQGITVTITSL